MLCIKFRTLATEHPSGMLIGRTTPHPLTKPLIHAMIREPKQTNTREMTTAQRMERQFFIQFIALVNEVQGKTKLPSQIHSKQKSTWVKQISNPKAKKDALSRI